MKKANILLLACAVMLAFSANAFAKSGLSVGIGIGLKPDLNNLGGTIMDDGLDGSESHIIWGKAIVDEKTLLVLDDKGVIEDLETNGAMSGLDFALKVRYDFLDKFFVSTGFNYTMKIMGGESSWKYGAATAQFAVNAGISVPNNATIVGKEGKQEFKSSAWGIPLLVGINVAAMDGKVNFYGGLGVNLSAGKWSVEITTPDIAFGIDLTTDSVEKVEFNYMGIAPMYAIGVSAAIVEGIEVFIEWETVLGVGYSDVEDLETTTGAVALGTDQLAYPVVTGGSILRVGATYMLPFL